MSELFVHGIGAVSPAGWGVSALRASLKSAAALPAKKLPRPGGKTLQVRVVPPPSLKLPFFANPRLRRTSGISQFAVAAALEALGEARSPRLGIVLCVMTGGVAYSRRFYDETLRDPTTASPVVFPETVFNAPASHLAALLGAGGINYTLVGDPGTFLQGLALAAEWLQNDLADACLVVGADEADWTTASAFRLFSRQAVLAEGAGAICLCREPPAQSAIAMRAITDSQLFFDAASRREAARRVRAELPASDRAELLCDSATGVAKFDAAERDAWKDWPGTRLSPKRFLGEGLMAGAAWQCVVAVDAVRLGLYPAAVVPVTGCNHQAIGARFEGRITPSLRDAGAGRGQGRGEIS